MMYVYVILYSHNLYLEDLEARFLGRTLPLENSFIHEFIWQIVLGTCHAVFLAEETRDTKTNK